MTGFFTGVGAAPPRAGNSSFGCSEVGLDTEEPKEGLAVVEEPKDGLAAVEDPKVGLAVELKVGLAVLLEVVEEPNALKSRVV